MDGFGLVVWNLGCWWYSDVKIVRRMLDSFRLLQCPKLGNPKS